MRTKPPVQAVCFLCLLTALQKKFNVHYLNLSFTVDSGPSGQNQYLHFGHCVCLCPSFVLLSASANHCIYPNPLLFLWPLQRSPLGSSIGFTVIIGCFGYWMHCLHPEDFLLNIQQYLLLLHPSHWLHKGCL